MHEKIRREDKVKIDMAIVKELMRYQEELNHSLRKTRYRCKLLPKSDLYPCSTCPKFKVCEKHAKERDYINSIQTSQKTSKRRQRQDNKSMEKSNTLNSHEGKERIYPCEPFDFSCPDRDNCNEGKDCSWKE